MESTQRPKVGLGILVFKDDQLLLGKRQGTTFANGYFAGPGGHVEFGETFEVCAEREILEETGLKVKNIRFLCVSNITNPSSNHHYVDIGMIADWDDGEPECREPNKCEGWAWYPINQLPEPMIPMEKLYLEAWTSGKTYFGTITEL